MGADPPDPVLKNIYVVVVVRRHVYECANIYKSARTYIRVRRRVRKSGSATHPRSGLSGSESRVDFEIVE